MLLVGDHGLEKIEPRFSGCQHSAMAAVKVLPFYEASVVALNTFAEDLSKL